MLRTFAQALRPYPSPSPSSPSARDYVGNSDLLPETFAVPATGVTVAHVALLETEVARLRALLGAQARVVTEARAEVAAERERRLKAEEKLDKVKEVVGGGWGAV